MTVSNVYLDFKNRFDELVSSGVSVEDIDVAGLWASVLKSDCLKSYDFSINSDRKVVIKRG